VDKVVVLVSRPPYGTSLAAEAFRYAIGLASMDVNTTVVLLEDGVFCLRKDQEPDALGMKPLGPSFAGLGDFGVRLLVLQESLRERGLTAAELMGGEEISLAQLAAVLEATEAVVRF